MQTETSFASWYQERHGYAPFPWQAALAARVAADDWPDALTPPTGFGKTAVIDVWLWARLEGHPVPRRLIYVIDRRLVVDGVSNYANMLVGTLSESDRPVVTTMRGGITIENDWLDPVKPAIIVTTVDQAGSRLLFRGYGVSTRAAPVHAALLGNDTLWVLDEVHLAEPFLRTLQDVAKMRGDSFDLPLRVLPMSATYASARSLGLSAKDRAHPALSRRLKTGRPARLAKVAENEDLVNELVRQAVELRQAGSGVVAVVCNRVARARAVFERLQTIGEAALLTGRIRPVDRKAILDEFLPRMAVGTRGSREPLYVVATQTIEVGADLDFDALVTECAPLSALRQRAGRLNRIAELDGAPMAIVYQPQKHDRVYGEATDAAWQWLGKVANKAKIVDFGIAAIDTVSKKNPPPVETAPGSPALLPVHVDILSHTSVAGRIDIAPWLHGWQSTKADVSICWRADWGRESVEAAPPSRDELLQVPLYALRQWAADFADIEGGEEVSIRDSSARPCVEWDGETATDTTLGHVGPGATVVLPASVGGYDRWGWSPESRAAVTDRGDTEKRIRLHPQVHPELADDISALLNDDASDAEWRALARNAGLVNAGRIVPYPGGVVVLERRDATSTTAMREIPLNEHSRAVGARAAQFAEAFGLPSALVTAVRYAGHGHDLGKRDPRWQAMIGGSSDVPLAKGPRGDTGWLSLPRGWRHEMAPALLQADPLVRHLIGTHHGHGRPLFPASPDLELWRQLSNWGSQFAALQATYGPWGLAFLEVLVRLADWQISEQEQEDDYDVDRVAA